MISRKRWRWWPRRVSTAPTRSSIRPGRAPRRRNGPTFVAPEVIAGRFARLRIVVERSALAKHEARVGRIEEVLIEGPSKRDPAIVSGRTGQNKLVHLPARPELPAGHLGRARITRAAPHFLAGEMVGGDGPPSPPDPHPRGRARGDRPSRPATRHLALVGCHGVGQIAAVALPPGPPARATWRWSRVDSMQVYRGMDIGTAKPTAAEQAEVPHHLLDLADPDEDCTVTR